MMCKSRRLASSQTFGPGWHFFGRLQNQSFQDSPAGPSRPQLNVRPASDSSAVPHASYASYMARRVSLTAESLTPPGMPVFVLNTGTVLAVSGYGYPDNRITYTLVREDPE